MSGGASDETRTTPSAGVAFSKRTATRHPIFVAAWLVLGTETATASLRYKGFSPSRHRFATPHLGWLWRWDPGFGFDLGVQLDVASSKTVVLPPQASEPAEEREQSGRRCVEHPAAGRELARRLALLVRRKSTQEQVAEQSGDSGRGDPEAGPAHGRARADGAEVERLRPHRRRRLECFFT